MSRVLDLLSGVTGVVFDFAGNVAPPGWLLCYGQQVSRTTYAALFATIGTTYGAGDGSTTFNVPDLRGLVVAGVGNMGGTASNRLGVSTTGTTTAGSAVVTAIPDTSGLSVGMKAIGSAIPSGATIASIDSATQVTLSSGTGVTAATAGAIRFGLIDGQTLGATGGAHVHKLTTPQMPGHTHPVNNAASTTLGGAYTTASTNAANGLQAVTTSTGGDQAHPNLQPTIVLNKIIKT